MRARKLLSVAAAAVVAVPSVVVGTGTASAGGPVVPKIAWGDCGDPKLAAFQCASVEVPTDYDRPRGETTTIGLTRLPASDPARRIGTLFTNPGGPGGSGVDFVHQLATVAYSAEVRARFDILGFDPRGVGRSDAVTCYPTAAEEQAALAEWPAFPVGKAEERKYTRIAASIAANCARTSPDRMAHFSTANVARDMDLLRQAVGDAKLTYAGYSYGTYLGATYAKLFPKNVRALMLDGTWFPSEYSGRPGDRRPVGVRLGQGPAAAKTFEQFKLECKRAGAERCALAGLGDPGTVVEDVLARVKSKPVVLPGPTGEPITVTYALLVQSTFSSLYEPAIWPDLAALYVEVAQASQPRTAKAAKLSAGASGLLQRKETYTSVGAVFQNCVEAWHPRRPLSYPAYADAQDRIAPHFGRMRTWTGLQCEFLPIRDHDAFLGPWTKLKVDAPVLVFGTRYDPATPYEDTRPYADLYRDPRMVTVNAWGHTTLAKNTCADTHITTYLTTLKAPADNTTCQPDRHPFDPRPTQTSVR
ncbi:alpha/beta hydrolase [Kribbella sp. CA-247076]|uniref:alpha/beta hydrolase n=1 Tax=Kribbella sp. CA-247076 TaxID=3239941 RepID=UPI003D8FC6F5